MAARTVRLAGAPKAGSVLVGAALHVFDTTLRDDLTLARPGADDAAPRVGAYARLWAAWRRHRD